MRQDGGAGVDVECRSDDFPRVDACAVDGAGEELFDAQNSVAIVEPEDVEFFMQECAQAHSEEVAGVTGVADAAQPFQLGLEDALGGGQHVVFGGFASEPIVAFAVFEDAHVLSPRRWIAPWAFRKQNGKGMQHPETIAERLVEGGNKVDEGTLAQADVKRRWPT